MNVSEQYLLKQMQTLAASMSGVPQSGGKDKTGETGSFQDLMNQIGKANETKGTKENPKSAETKDEAPQEKVEEVESETVSEESGVKKEELKPEQLAANPNAVNLLDMFRPDVVQPVEEPVVELPVEAIPEESVGGPDLALDDQTFQMETGVEADVDAGVSMEQQPETFRETLKEASQPQEERPVENNSEQPAETVQNAPETPEAAPEQKVENTDKPREEAPEIEVEVKTDEEEPKAEAADIRQPVFHEVESAPVKVGETYETVDTEKPDMEAKLADTIQAAIQNGQQKIEIHLTPQNLGSLTIEIAKDASGVLQVVLHTASAKAASLLNDHMNGLQMALRGYSQEEVRIEVQRGDETQEQHSRQADPDGRGSQQNQKQQQEHHEEEKNAGEAFIQKLRLGLFGTDEI